MSGPAPARAPGGDFAALAQALTTHAARLARARAAQRRAGDARWRDARLLWPLPGSGD